MKLRIEIELDGDFEQPIDKDDIEALMNYGAESCYASVTVNSFETLEQDDNNE